MNIKNILFGALFIAATGNAYPTLSHEDFNLLVSTLNDVIESKDEAKDKLLNAITPLYKRANKTFFLSEEAPDLKEVIKIFLYAPTLEQVNAFLDKNCLIAKDLPAPKPEPFFGKFKMFLMELNAIDKYTDVYKEFAFYYLLNENIKNDKSWPMSCLSLTIAGLNKWIPEDGEMSYNIEIYRSVNQADRGLGLCLCEVSHKLNPDPAFRQELSYHLKNASFFRKVINLYQIYEPSFYKKNFYIKNYWEGYPDDRCTLI